MLTFAVCQDMRDENREVVGRGGVYSLPLAFVLSTPKSAVTSWWSSAVSTILCLQGGGSGSSGSDVNYDDDNHCSESDDDDDDDDDEDDENSIGSSYDCDYPCKVHHDNKVDQS